MTTLQAIGTGIAGAVVGLLLSVVLGSGHLGGVYNQVQSHFAQGISVGPTDQQIAQVLKGTCSLIAPSFNIVASTSVAMDCAITGVLPGDIVFASFATSTPTAAGPGWEVVGASASSTIGYITLRISNGTGGTATIPQSIASVTPYLIVR